MKNNNIITTYIPKTNYANESLTVIKECCDNLVELNFYNNDKLENLNLLEQSLFSYSIIKLLKWENKEFDMKSLTGLENICELINTYIPTDEERISYFTQYIHCIIFITGKINKQPEISWKQEEIDETIIFEYKNDIITKIITNKNIPTYQIPSLLISEIKKLYEKEKILLK